MLRRRGIATSIGIIGLCCAAGGAAPQSLAAGTRAVTLDVEALGAWQLRNDVRSPNVAPSTRFALDALTGDGPFVAPRLQVTLPSGERSEWRLLAAPLSLTRAGVLGVPVRFEGATFAPGAVRARYQFDSWRVTWRWHWIERPDLSVKLGFTAKLRDASIELRQGALAARKDDTGFVPLLHAALERPLSGRWALKADLDALAGGPGYAVDAGARLVRDLGGGWSASAGLRFLDGGADNDEVYAFASFASVTLGVSRRFE